MYKNTKTKALDTIIYDNYTEKMLHFKGERYEYDREDIQFNMHSKTWGYTQRCENGHPIEDGNKEYKSHFWFRKSQSENGGGGFVGEVAFLGFPQDTTLNGNDGGIDIHLHPTFTVQGQMYQNVVEFEIQPDYVFTTVYSDHTSYYWAPNVGIIKQVLYKARENRIEDINCEVIAFQLNP